MDFLVKSLRRWEITGSGWDFWGNNKMTNSIKKRLIHFSSIDLLCLLGVKVPSVDSLIDEICLEVTLTCRCTHLCINALYCHCYSAVLDNIMQDLILYVRSVYIWSMVMSRCLIISQAYKRAIGLPVAAVILIDGGQVGATVLPSDRLCLFIQSAVCPPYPPQGYIRWIYSRQERKKIC